MNPQEKGRRGEYLARLYLEQKGFVFLRANYRTPEGEVDLIMQDGDRLVFAEVKTRDPKFTERYGRGILRIDDEKQRKIKKAAARFLREEPRLSGGLVPRFDDVELYWETDFPDKVFVIHTPDAFFM